MRILRLVTWKHIAALVVGVGAGVVLAITGHETMGSSVASTTIGGIFGLLRSGGPPPPAAQHA